MDDLELDIKQMLFRTQRGRVYRVVFFIDGNNAFILRVRGPGQAPVAPTDLAFVGAAAVKRSAKYEPVIQALAAAGCVAQFHSQGQLVVCKLAPVPTGRIWITWQDCWYISTWTPAIYAVPNGADIVALCVTCVHDTGDDQAFHQIPEAIVQRFALRRLDAQETARLLEVMG